MCKPEGGLRKQKYWRHLNSSTCAAWIFQSNAAFSKNNEAHKGSERGMIEDTHDMFEGFHFFSRVPGSRCKCNLFNDLTLNAKQRVIQ